VEVKHSRRWRGAAGNGGQRRNSRGAEEQRRGARGRRKREGGPRDWFAKIEKSRDLTVNLNFPLIQKPNEKMMKIEVVEFFKPYNIALGFKFKNLKYNALFYNFALKSNLIKFRPY
jgi:hypothetical protein